MPSMIRKKITRCIILNQGIEPKLSFCVFLKSKGCGERPYIGLKPIFVEYFASIASVFALSVADLFFLAALHRAVGTIAVKTLFQLLGWYHWPGASQIWYFCNFPFQIFDNLAATTKQLIPYGVQQTYTVVCFGELDSCCIFKSLLLLLLLLLPSYHVLMEHTVYCTA